MVTGVSATYHGSVIVRFTAFSLRASNPAATARLMTHFTHSLTPGMVSYRPRNLEDDSPSKQRNDTRSYASGTTIFPILSLLCSSISSI